MVIVLGLGKVNSILKIIIAIAIIIALCPYNMIVASAEEDGTIIDGTTISSEPFDEDQNR